MQQTVAVIMHNYTTSVLFFLNVLSSLTSLGCSVIRIYDSTTHRMYPFTWAFTCSGSLSALCRSLAGLILTILTG